MGSYTCSAGSVARLMGAIEAARAYAAKLLCCCRRSGKVQPLEGPADQLTAEWLQSCGFKAKQQPAGEAGMGLGPDLIPDAPCDLAQMMEQRLAAKASSPAQAEATGGADLIAAVPAAPQPATGSPAAAATPAEDPVAQPQPTSHVGALIQQFEALSPRKQAATPAHHAAFELRADCSSASGESTDETVQHCVCWGCISLCAF